MLLAALGNIRGNPAAFDAVLEAIDERGILTIVNTGDCVVGGSRPNDVVERIRSRSLHSVQGDMDRTAGLFLRQEKRLRRTLAPDVLSSVETAHARLRSDHLEYLLGLPRHLEFALEGISIYVCHGSPAGQTDDVRPTDGLEKLRRLREIANASIVIVGHGVEAFARWVDDTLFVHPGIVDYAPGLARFAVMDTECSPWAVEFVEAAYGPPEAV